MRSHHWFLLVAVLFVSSVSAGEPLNEGAARAAVERALPLILKGASGHNRHRDCFACHHHAVPILAASIARDRGFAVDAEVLDSIVDQTRSDLDGAIDSYRKGQGQGGGSTRAGYALLTLKTAGVPPDDLTAAVAGFLLGRDEDRPGWRTTSDRPPSEASDFTTSFVSIAALQAYGTAADRERIDGRLAKVRTWLESAHAATTEDRVFRLFAMKAVSAGPESIGAAVAELKAAQHADGGWSQLPGAPSDAYATGSVLVALHQAGGLSTRDPAYIAGMNSLLETQLADGSWHVVSRSKPFQPYFESGFPHGTDQFISMAASSWATAALALASPISGDPPSR